MKPAAAVSDLVRRVAAGLLLLVACTALPVAAQDGTERKVALLIGNSEYADSPLTNPARDVQRLAATLRSLGFTIIGGEPKQNLDKAGMERAIRDLRAHLGKDTVAFFYFSGHGLSIRDTSYLVPVRAQAAREQQADDAFVNVRNVVETMGGSGSKLSMIVLDACRNVPFRESLRERTSAGLAALNAPGGVLISYATQPGNTASDGDPNAESGPYVAALVEALRTPGLSFVEVFNRAGLLVSQKSNGRQRPWLSLSPIEGTFHFLAAGAPVPELGEAPARPAAPPARPTLRDCPECPELVRIEAGRFDMGWDKGEADEQPVHGVSIARPFAIGRYEVTFAEWDACVASGGCRHKPDDMRWGRERRPAINVSWDDAQAYVAWLSQRAGKRYRLPSEAEWEWAARAGQPLSGRLILFGLANCYGCGSEWDYRETGPVGSFRANDWGVHDMLGNVWEWVQDCATPTYAGAPADGSAVAGDGACAARGVRGGSWVDRTSLMRPTNRGSAAPGTRNALIGFRVVREE